MYPRTMLRPLTILSPYSRPGVRTFSRNTPHCLEGKPRPKIRVLDPKQDPSLFEDHRKPWFFTVNKIGNFLVIPTIILYAVFYYDFGDHEHVFSPARRWLDQQKAAFFNLSPEERELAKHEAQKGNAEVSSS